MSLRCRILGHKMPLRGESEPVGQATFETLECKRCGEEWTFPVR